MTESKRKIVCIAVLLCLCLITAVPVALCAYASAPAISDEDFNIVTSIIHTIATEENVDLSDAEYTVNDVYFSNEQRAGYVVDFATASINGYSVFFKIDGSFTLVEISFDRSSPYLDKQGLFVYPSLGYYFIKTDGKYYDAETMEQLVDYKPTDEPTFYAACSNKNESEFVPKEITYTRSIAEIDEISDFYFEYSVRDSISHKVNANNCSNVAGVVALNYWNKYYNNDLLKLSAEELLNNNISVQKVKSAAGVYMDIFYDYMNTNWFFGTGGTLPKDCYKGFERLIAEKGYKTERIQCNKYYEMQENIQKGYPVFITSKDYYFTTGATGTVLPEVQPEKGNYTSTFYYNRHHGISSAHTFIGYGYHLYNFIVNNAIEFGRFVKVADGWGTTCYFNYDLSKVTDAVAIRVYK